MPARKPQEEMPAEVREQVNLLKTMIWTTRFHAADALGNLGHPGAIPQLVEALRDEHHMVSERAAASLAKIGRSLQGKEVGGEAQALQLVAEHFHEREDPIVVRKAYQAALKGKVTPVNARLFVKQLRALKGNVK